MQHARGLRQGNGPACKAEVVVLEPVGNNATRKAVHASTVQLVVSSVVDNVSGDCIALNDAERAGGDFHAPRHMASSQSSVTW